MALGEGCLAWFLASSYFYSLFALGKKTAKSTLHHQFAGCYGLENGLISFLLSSATLCLLLHCKIVSVCSSFIQWEVPKSIVQNRKSILALRFMSSIILIIENALASHYTSDSKRIEGRSDSLKPLLDT